MQKRVFTPKQLVVSALLCAISVIFGKLPAIDLSSVLRISFENLPIILAGFAYGPLIGGFVGGVADVLGCLLKGYAINPIITLGAVSVGAIAGVVSFLLFKRSYKTVPLLLSVVLSHIVGSIVIKTAGLYLWYESLRPTLIFRLPIYAITAACEFVILLLLFKSKALKRIILGDMK